MSADDIIKIMDHAGEIIVAILFAFWFFGNPFHKDKDYP